MGMMRLRSLGLCLTIAGVACGADVVEEDKPETAEQARDDIPRRYGTWQEACEWRNDWERAKGGDGLGPCQDFDCITPPASAECAELLRRIYACQSLGLEQSAVPLSEQRCTFGGVSGCTPENLAVIDGEPRTYEDTAALWDDTGDCQREQQSD